MAVATLSTRFVASDASRISEDWSISDKTSNVVEICCRMRDLGLSSLPCITRGSDPVHLYKLVLRDSPNPGSVLARRFSTRKAVVDTLSLASTTKVSSIGDTESARDLEH